MNEHNLNKRNIIDIGDDILLYKIPKNTSKLIGNLNFDEIDDDQKLIIVIPKNIINFKSNLFTCNHQNNISIKFNHYDFEDCNIETNAFNGISEFIFKDKESVRYFDFAKVTSSKFKVVYSNYGEFDRLNDEINNTIDEIKSQIKCLNIMMCDDDDKTIFIKNRNDGILKLYTLNNLIQNLKNIIDSYSEIYEN